MSRSIDSRLLLLACGLTLALSAAGCAAKSTATTTDDITTTGNVTGVKQDAGSTDVGPGAGEVGAACTKNEDCHSVACDAGTCAATCTGSKDCTDGRECITLDGSSAFCHKPTYPTGMGLACYMGAACPGNLSCLGNDGSPHAVCTTTCSTNADCPSTMECRINPNDSTGATNACRPRAFCASCVTDDQCGAGSVCADMGQGAKFCTHTCDIGSFECPRYADCTKVTDPIAGDRNVCTHRSGTCIGDGTECQPCADDLCATSDYQCLTFGQSGESFCAITCAANADCGTGYKCTQVAADGTKRCVPSSNRCVGKLTELYKKGDIFEDYAFLGRVDTNGDGLLSDEEPKLIHLSDFADKQLIGLTVSAGWCVPCQEETKTFASTLKTYGDKAIIVQVLIEDANEGGGHIDLDYSLVWIKQFKPAGVSGIDTDGNPDRWNLAGSIPLNILLDGATRKVLDKQNGSAPGGWATVFAANLK